MKIVVSAVIAVAFADVAQAGEVSKRYRAVAVPAPRAAAGTWAVLDRDGANRDVGPYLSSLGGGEQGTGSISSPPFTLTADRVTFALNGHDGSPGTSQGKNFVALVDAATGNVLRKEAAPASDAFVEKGWDVKDLKGRKVRFEARDGIAEGAFAWMGVARIDAGPELKLDFRPGMPAGWKAAKVEAAPKPTVFAGTWIPFRDSVTTFVPDAGVAKIPCGFAAKRLFFLGCTVEHGRVRDRRGEIAVVYDDGTADRIPLIIGATLECENKVLSGSRAMRLRSSGEPFLYVLAVKPKAKGIARIDILRDPSYPGALSIRGITAETDAAAPTLLDLPAVEPGAEDAAWIESRAVAGGSPGEEAIIEELKR